MTELLIVGAGGHGRVVADAAVAEGRWSRIVFLDDAYPQLRSTGPWRVVGRVGEAAGLADTFHSAFVAVGENSRRLELLGLLRDAGFEVPVIRHPEAWVSVGAEIGSGCVILAQAVVAYGATLGSGVIVNHGATVDHDCHFGDGVHVCPGAHVAGDVSVGRLAWLGVGASIREGVRVGERVTIGAGAAVIDDLPDGVVAVGVPARPRLAE